MFERRFPLFALFGIIQKMQRMPQHQKMPTNQDAPTGGEVTSPVGHPKNATNAKKGNIFLSCVALFG